MKPGVLSLSTAFAAALAAATLLAPRPAHAASCSPATVNASDIPAWKPPKVAPAACTQTEANKFQVAFDASTATADTMEASVSAGCKDCIFSQDATSASWQIIVWTNRAMNEGIYNTASCLSAAGASQSCAGARYGDDTCSFDSCSACTDGTSFGSCITSSKGGVCKPYADAAANYCDATSDAAFTACGIDPQTGTGNGVAKLVMQVCGGDPASSGGTKPGTTPGGTNNDNGSTSGGNDSTGTGQQQATNGGTPSKSSGSGAMSSLQLDENPRNQGGCSATGASSNPASSAPIGLALVGLLVAARRKRARA